jgi:tetratricopeptide (TPR) repeat protein/predicted Ser/Thr protein kinase
MVETVCPSEKILVQLAKGLLLGDEAKNVRAHAVTCPKCSLYLVGSGQTAAAPPLQASCPPEQSLLALARGKILGDSATELRKHAQSCEKCSLYLMGQSDTTAGNVLSEPCPSEQSLRQVVQGTLRGQPADTIRTHAKSCPKCSDALTGPNRPGAAPLPQSGCPPQQSLSDVVRGTLSGKVEKEIRAHAQSCPKCSLYLMSQGQTAAGLAPSDLCPPEATLVQLGSGQLKGPAAAEIRVHTDKCPKCSVFLAALGDHGGDVAQAHALADAVFAGDQPSRYVAEFRLVRMLGQGAMGQVYLAHDTFLDRLVAVKFLAASESTPAARERFFVEARAVARLQHPNVVTLYRAGEEDGQRYIVSEYVRGQSLEKLEKPQSFQKVLDLALGLARGLATAHQRGVLHRDIKPANTMLTDGGEVKILDFGLAKLVSSQADADPGSETPATATPVDAGQMSSLALTRTGSLLGTPLYMAPEIWQGRVATARTDVYSLGAMLYELCSGKTPHNAESVPALKDLIIGHDAKPLSLVAPGVPAKLAAIIDRCLRRDPQERFASGLELRDAFEAIAVKVPFLTRRVAAVAAALVVILFASLGGVTVARERQAKRQAVLAQRLGQEIKDMEWTLRSARQLPLHDLNREKQIVRKRMAQLQREMLGYGEMGRSLAHYALGRGHLALQEYPQALSQLEKAIALGYPGADAQYALGLVLGLHYQQAKAALFDGGPPEWVKGRLQPLQAQYLNPALTALKRSRQMKHDEPLYLEGLISFYQGDYDTALSHAESVLKAAPWFYEALVLAGDVYTERGQYARSHKSGQEAVTLLAKGAEHYERAAAIGNSDAEVYDKLASAWNLSFVPAMTLGTPLDKLYDGALAATGKELVAEPGSVSARLRRSYADQWLVMPTLGGSASSDERVAQCLKGPQSILVEQPEHLDALLHAGNCHLVLADFAMSHGVDTIPMLRQAIAIFERVVARDETHYNAARALGIAHVLLLERLVKRGSPEVKSVAERGQRVMERWAKIEPTVSEPYSWAVGIHRYGAFEAWVSSASSDQKPLLSKLDAVYERVRTHNDKDGIALILYMSSYAVATHRAALAGQPYEPLLKRTLDLVAQLRAQGTNMFEAEQHALLAHYVEARGRVLAHRDPTPILATMEEELKRCLENQPDDATCLAHAALADWVASDWNAQNKRPVLPPLKRALERALAASKRPERIVGPQQILAETYLRLANAGVPEAERRQYIASGLDAAQRILAIFPDLPSGLATQGSLLLLQAKEEPDRKLSQAKVREALGALEKATARDALLPSQHVDTLQAARSLAQALGV